MISSLLCTCFCPISLKLTALTSDSRDKASFVRAASLHVTLCKQQLTPSLAVCFASLAFLQFTRFLSVRHHLSLLLAVSSLTSPIDYELREDFT